MGKTAIVLVAVDEPHRSALSRAACERDMEAIWVAGEFSEGAASKPFGLAIVQVSANDEERLEGLRSLRKLLRGTPVVVLHDELAPELVFRMSRMGVEALVRADSPPGVVVDACLRLLCPRSQDALSGLVGNSPEIRRVRHLIRRAAQVDSNVLLTGETGTGKTVTARAIHRLSARSGRPFVQVDCSALAPGLIESELFGHERGAFTGAVRGRQGRFDMAGDGVIFLDEIGELSTALQSKFLRVIEEREFERVGGGNGRSMSARVISATSRNLSSEIERGRFRSDLYYRLRILEIRLPSLRDRLEDVPDLVEAGLERISARLGLARPEVRSDFVERLMMHSWPGNVRELMNVLEAVLARTEDHVLDQDHADDVIDAPGRGGAFLALPAAGALDGQEDWDLAPDRSEARPERAEIAHLLVSAGGNVARVARRLGMARSTLRYKIKRYGLGDLIPKD